MSFRPKTKPNAIVTCCTANWLHLAACTLKSCWDQGGGDLADFYIVALGISDKDRAEFQTFLSRHKFSATIIDGILPEELLDRAPKRFSAAAYLRLVMDKVLDPEYHRVLYLDSDILALGPIQEVLDYDLDGKLLGAVEDYQSFPTRSGGHALHPQSIGLPAGSRYFNSGVLLFDWPQTLARNKIRECLDRILALTLSKKKMSFPDQDVMNLVFAGEWQRMPTRFNLISIVSDYFPEKPVFRHFTRDHKPWHKVVGIGYSDFYLQYFSMLQGTPWVSQIETRFPSIAPIITLGNYLRQRDKKTRLRYQNYLES